MSLCRTHRNAWRPACAVARAVVAAALVLALTQGARAEMREMDLDLNAAVTAAGDPGTGIAMPSAVGMVRGQVVGANGEPLGDVEVKLSGAGGLTRTTTTEDDGTFWIAAVTTGAFTVEATEEGLEAASVSGTMPTGGELDLPVLTLKMPTMVTSVNAITQEEAAELEVKAEEHQRILGAIPNFFVTYDAEPVPLTAKQKFRLSVRTLFDPMNIAISAAIAGGQQWSGSYAGFGSGASGFAKRFGATYGDGASGIMLTGAVMPALFHQDPRYFYKGTGTVRSRVMYVLKQAVEQKGDNGRWQFAWSNTLGGVGSALISNTYYPSQTDKWTTLTGENFGLQIVSQGISNMLQEFVFGRITTRRAGQ